MDWFNISLNAVSVVNLVMCVGISVEFCVHIANSFAENHGSREDRAIKVIRLKYILINDCDDDN